MPRTKLKPPPPLDDVIQATPGKPKKYSAAVAREILDRVAAGELLSDICKDTHLPERRTWYRWVEADDALHAAHLRARVAWSEFHAEQMLKIASDSKGNYIDQNGNRLPLSHEEVGQRRLYIDTVKFLVAKLAPRIFGDKPEPPAEPEQQITKITRVIINSPNRDAAIPVPREPGEPLQLSYVPKLPTPDGPLPETVQARLRGILERCVPSNRHANPYALWDEVAGVIERALTAHFEN